MLGRNPGEVLCAHCQGGGASTACRACGKLLCATCSSRWFDCEEKRGRVFRLGRGARLRGVDGVGRFALVSRFVFPPRLLDLQTGRWGAAMSRNVLFPSMAIRLLGEGQWLEPWHAADGTQVVFLGLKKCAVGSDEPALLFGGLPGRALRVTRNGAYAWLINTHESIDLYDLRGGDRGARQIDALPGSVVQAAVIDDEASLLLAATWGEIRVLRLDAGEEVYRGRLRPEDGDIRSLNLAGRRVVAVIEPQLGAYVLAAWDLDDHDRAGEPFFRCEIGADFDGGAADLSSDGRLWADASRGDAIEIIELDSGRRGTYRGHTDGVSFIAFADRDRLLISGDNDNRVIVRTRADDGSYEVPLVEEKIGG